MGKRLGKSWINSILMGVIAGCVLNGCFLFLLFSSLGLYKLTGVDSAHSQELLGVKLIKPILNVVRWDFMQMSPVNLATQCGS